MDQHHQNDDKTTERHGALNDDSDEDSKLISSKDTENDSRKTIISTFWEMLSCVASNEGILWALAASLFMATQFIALKTVTEKFGIWQAQVFRNSFLILLAFRCTRESLSRIEGKDAFLLLIAGIFDIVSIVSMASATLYISAGDISTIVFNQPVPSCVLAWIFLGEYMDILDGSFVVVNGIGLVFISTPSFLQQSIDQIGTIGISSNGSRLPYVGVILAFIGLSGGVLYTIIARMLVHRGTDDPYLLGTIVGILGISTSFFLVTVYSQWQLPSSLEDILQCCCLSISTLGTVYSFLKGLEETDVMTASVLLTLAIPMVTVFDVVVFNTPIGWLQVGGVSLVLGSTVAFYIKRVWKTVETQPELDAPAGNMDREVSR